MGNANDNPMFHLGTTGSNHYGETKNVFQQFKRLSLVHENYGIFCLHMWIYKGGISFLVSMCRL